MGNRAHTNTRREADFLPSAHDAQGSTHAARIQSVGEWARHPYWRCVIREAVGRRCQLAAIAAQLMVRCPSKRFDSNGRKQPVPGVQAIAIAQVRVIVGFNILGLSIPILE